MSSRTLPKKAKAAIIAVVVTLAMTAVTIVTAHTARLSVPAQAAPGSTINVSGTGFNAVEGGHLTYNGEVLAQFQASSGGSFSVPFTIPSDARSGTGRISARADDDDRDLLATTTLRIGADGGPSPGPTSTAEPTATPTPGPTDTPGPTPTAGSEPTPTAIASSEPTPMPTPTPTATPTSTSGPGLPNFSHIYLIVMENKEQSSIVGSSSAPYINSLIAQYGLATNYYAVGHPSEPNYIALTSGGTQGVNDDGVYDLGTDNLFDQVEASGRTWRAYEQGYPGNCFTGSSSGAVADGVGQAGAYVRKHDPAISYTSINGNSARCGNIANLASFDPAAADFEFITPNLINDMHDGSVQDGDNFLRAFLPEITASPAFANSVLFLTFDEGDTNVNGGGHVTTIAITPHMMPGYQASASYTHYSLLRTIEQAWGLPYLGNAASAAAMAFPY
jgi:Phosphoesterase family.